MDACSGDTSWSTIVPAYSPHSGESVGSVGADRDYTVNNKKIERKAQGAEGIYKSCIESMSPLLRLIRGFRNIYD